MTREERDRRIRDYASSDLDGHKHEGEVPMVELDEGIKKLMNDNTFWYIKGFELWSNNDNYNLTPAIATTNNSNSRTGLNLGCPENSSYAGRNTTPNQSCTIQWHIFTDLDYPILMNEHFLTKGA